MAKTGLTRKQFCFAQEYLIDKNATRAAKVAGYSEKTAYSQGQRLLKNVEVAVAIETGLKEQADKAKVTADRVIKRLAEFAFENKSQRPSDTLKACELLGKHFKLFTEKSEVTTQSSPDVVVYLSPPKESNKLLALPDGATQPRVILHLPDNGRSVDSPLKKEATDYS